MLEIVPAPEGVVAMRVSGRIETADIDRAIVAVEAALSKHEHIALFSEVSLAGVDPGALWKDLSYGLGKLGELHRFRRVAVVTGQDWVRWIAQAESALLPGIEMRAFTDSERGIAWSWITEPLPEAISEDPEQVRPAVTFVATSRSDVVAFEVNGRLTAADARELLRVFNDAMAENDRLRILVLMRDFHGMTLGALRERGLLDAKIRGWKQVERYALVGAPVWMAGMARMIGPSLGIETRNFELSEEGAAWQWIGAEPAS